MRFFSALVQNKAAPDVYMQVWFCTKNQTEGLGLCLHIRISSTPDIFKTKI